MATELHQEGLKFLLEAAFSETQAVPANFYIGLCTDTSLAEDASLASKTEVGGTGYARQTVASDGTDFTSATAGTTDWKMTTKSVTFTAGGTWTGAKTVFLASTVADTGKLIASAPLSTTRQLNNGDMLTVALEITLAG
jgi:hypothetical protein